MRKEYFALSYDDDKGTPNWVSWRLVKDDLGHALRPDVFLPDDDLPPGFTKVFTRDYNGAGFDRGHMCPAGDRSASPESIKATFVMTNVVPQSPANNRKTWERLETYCRNLAHRGKELYIVCGPAGKGGEGEKGFKESIHDGKVVVPAQTWKVVLVLDKGGAPDGDARLIGVIVPNDESVNPDWSKYRVPVKEVETLTGYKFFDKADPAVVGPLKEKKDRTRISVAADDEDEK
jgi:endonuclease G